MEIAIFISIAISIAHTLLKSDLLLLQFIPAALLLCAFIGFYNRYRQEFLPHFVAFSLMFLFIVVAPYFLQGALWGTGSVFGMLNYLVIIAFVMLLLFILFRMGVMKRTVEGKVMLADKDNAVVELDLDFFAGIRAGKYVVKNSGAKKGDKVYVSLKSKIFGGAVPERIARKK